MADTAIDIYRQFLPQDDPYLTPGVSQPPPAPEPVVERQPEPPPVQREAIPIDRATPPPEPAPPAGREPPAEPPAEPAPGGFKEPRSAFKLPGQPDEPIDDEREYHAATEQ